MARPWLVAAVVPLLLSGCFSFGFEHRDGTDWGDDNDPDREFFFTGSPGAGFLLFILLVVGFVVLVVNLSQRPAPPPAKETDDGGDEDEPPRPGRRKAQRR